jgi:hypothetical protein
MTAPSPCYFDQRKPFYPLVANYVCQLVGAAELAVRGVAGPRNLDELVESTIARERARGISASDPEMLREQLRALTRTTWRLRSEMLDNDIKLSVDTIAKEIADNFAYLMPRLVDVAAGMVLVMAHEISKHKRWYTKGQPLWEFLFHCRNAVALDLRFRFNNKQPHHPAQWGPLVISSALQGSPLFKTDGGMLSPGDPVRLLWDIEQAFPTMTT